MSYVVNPEAVGDPDQTPVVQLDADTVAAMRASGLICACGGMNGYHTSCPKPPDARDRQEGDRGDR